MGCREPCADHGGTNVSDPQRNLYLFTWDMEGDLKRAVMGQKWHSWCAPQTVRYRISRPRKAGEGMISPGRQMTAEVEEPGRAPSVGRQ